MERQLYGSPLSGAPGKARKKYVEPVLSEVAFTAEKGFASSAVIDGALIKNTMLEDQSDSSWI